MYLEYLFVIFDYFGTLNKRLIVYEWIIPLLISIGSLLNVLINNVPLGAIYSFIESTINFLGILLGLTLAILIFFISTDNKQIQLLKQKKTSQRKNGKQITIYKYLITNYSYLIVVEAFLCLSFFIGILFQNLTNSTIALILNYIFIWIFIHIVFLTIRSVSDLYFSISAKNDNQEKL